MLHDILQNGAIMRKKPRNKSTIEKKKNELHRISRALKEELKSRNQSPEAFVTEKKCVSVKTIYNILNEEKLPRKSTIEAIEKALGLRAGTLNVAYVFFDWEYFYNIVRNIFNPYDKKNEDLWKFSPEMREALENGEVDPLCGEPTVEEFLIIKCNMDYAKHIRDHKMPTWDIQNQVAKEFGKKPEELFKPLLRPYLKEDIAKKYPKKDILTHLDLKREDKDTMIKLFNDLRPEYQKIVFNSIVDFYLLSEH